MASGRVDLSEFEGMIRGQGPNCGVVTVLEQLSADDGAKLEAALWASHIPATVISQWCKDRGVRLTEYSVSRHRRKQCRCDD